MQFINNRQFGVRLNEFFDLIYCINLDDRPDRWRYVSDHFAKFGLKGKIERFSAIDVRNDTELQRHEKLLLENYSLLAMCGCMLSHRKIVESAKQSGLKNILVFEDDVKILETNIADIHNSLSDLARLDWDIFYLGATYLWELKAVSSNLVNRAVPQREMPVPPNYFLKNFISKSSWRKYNLASRLSYASGRE